MNEGKLVGDVWGYPYFSSLHEYAEGSMAVSDQAILMLYMNTKQSFSKHSLQIRLVASIVVPTGEQHLWG
jgi:hypothetical protein